MSFLNAHPSTIVAMQACAKAHFWAREIGSVGHEVCLIAPQYARAYVKTNKTDAADVEVNVETSPTDVPLSSYFSEITSIAGLIARVSSRPSWTCRSPIPQELSR